MSEEKYELFMPFVTVKSNGGTHEDRSYVHGYEMGALDKVLGTMRHFGIRNHTAQIHTDNQPQADMLAMHYRMSVEFHTYDEAPEWTEAHFELLPVGVAVEDE